MKNIAGSLAVALLLGSTNAQNNKALAEEYLRKVYAQVGETYLAQTETDEAGRRRRRVIKKEEYKDYHNIYPAAEGAIAKLRGKPWPCTEKEPCGEGEGTCMNPHETLSHPDALCKEPFFCQNRVGGSRGGKGEAVEGVEFTGLLKMHHMGANDICYDDEWETYGGGIMHMAVLRRKLAPCTDIDTDDPYTGRCDIGEGDCNNNNNLCKEGLHCAFRADEQTGAGEPLHGVEFIGDLLQNAKGANDLCYNPHWPDSPDASYEGKVVRSCDAGGNNCKGPKYLVLDGERRPIDDASFEGLWPGPEVIIDKPHDAFKDIPVAGDLCPNTPVIKSADPKHKGEYIVIGGKKRLIANAATHAHLRLKKDIAQTIPQCAFDALEEGIPINYGVEDGPVKVEKPKIVKKAVKKVAAKAYSGYKKFDAVGNLKGGGDRGTKHPLGADHYLGEIHLCTNGKRLARGEQVEYDGSGKEVQRQNFGAPEKELKSESFKCDSAWKKVKFSTCWTKAKVCTEDSNTPFVNSLTLYRKGGGEDTFHGSTGKCYGKEHVMDTNGGCLVSLFGKTGTVVDTLGFYYNHLDYWKFSPNFGGSGGSDKGYKAPNSPSSYLADLKLCPSGKYIGWGKQVEKNLIGGPDVSQNFGKDKDCDGDTVTTTHGNCWTKAQVCTDTGNHDYVSSVTLTKKDGSKNTWSGKDGCIGKKHDWAAPNGDCITTIKGRTGGHTDSMGFQFAISNAGK